MVFKLLKAVLFFEERYDEVLNPMNNYCEIEKNNLEWRCYYEKERANKRQTR